MAQTFVNLEEALNPKKSQTSPRLNPKRCSACARNRQAPSYIWNAYAASRCVQNVENDSLTLDGATGGFNCGSHKFASCLKAFL